MIDMLRIINIMVGTNRDKNRDKLKISEKNENICEILKSFKEKTGSWSNLAKKIYYKISEDEAEETPLPSPEEEQKIIRKFSTNLKNAIRRNQDSTDLDGKKIYLRDICDRFELPYIRNLPSQKTPFDKQDYIEANTHMIYEIEVKWDTFIDKYLNNIKEHSDAGFTEAKTMLGNFYYYHGYNGIRNITKAIELYISAAEENDELALYQLGRIYEYGDKEISPDANQALKYYKKAADKNFPLALNKLAYCYYQGIGTQKNMSKFFEYAKKCESVDDIVGKLYLAFAYSNGIGTNESPSDAIKIYETLLTIEDAKQYKMEILWALCKLYKSEGEYQDLTKAEEYFKTSLDTYNKLMTQAWEMNVMDIVWNIFTLTPERYNGILKNAHYDYVNKPERPTVIRALFEEYESK